MNTIYLKAGKMQAIFNDLKEDLNGILMCNNQHYNLDLKSNFVKGNIKGTTFSDGKTYMNFDIIFSENTRLSIESFSAKPLFFAYCTAGKLQQSFGEFGKKKTLKKNHSGVLRSTASVNNILYFEKNISIRFSVISVATTANFQNNGLLSKLKSTFVDAQEDYFDIQIQDFKIAQKIKEVNSISETANVNELQSKILDNILNMEIDQNTDGFSKIAQSIYNFTLRRWDEIKSASNFIIHLPEEIYARFSTLKTGWFTNRILHHFMIFVKTDR